MEAQASNAKWVGVGVSREELHERKRRALVSVAAQVFRDKGVQETSMDDIAAELNVSKAAIYYYVKNKQELLFLCHSLAFDLGNEALQEAMEKGKTGAERLEIIIRSYIHKLTSELGGGALMTSDSALSPKHLKVIRRRRQEWDQVFRSFVEEGVKEGSLRAVDPRLIEFFVMGAIRGLHRWYSPQGPKSGEEIADELVAMVFDGIRSQG